jgi:opacity protein-like surface antigen
MKTTLLSAAALIGLTFTAFAGNSEASYSSKDAVASSPTAELFVGAGAEYMDSLDTTMATFKLGYVFPTDSAFSIAAFAQVGFADTHVDGAYVQYVPVTANLEVRYDITDSIYAYAGGGVGVAYTRIAGDTEWVLLGQLSTGLGYRFTDNWSVNAGVTYTWNDLSSHSVIEDQVSYGVSLNYTF